MDDIEKLSCSKYEISISVTDAVQPYFTRNISFAEEDILEISDLDHSPNDEQKEVEEKPKKKKRRRREIDMVTLGILT